MSAKDEVRKTSQRFYAALNHMVNGDARDMAEVWSHRADVTTLHPVGGRQIGWKQVADSWNGVAEISSNGTVTLKDQHIRVIGDVAYELGIEHVEMTLAGKQIQGGGRVTNIYHREDGTWKIIHHHTDTDPAMQEALPQKQAA